MKRTIEARLDNLLRGVWLHFAESQAFFKKMRKNSAPPSQRALDAESIRAHERTVLARANAR